LINKTEPFGSGVRITPSEPEMGRAWDVDEVERRMVALMRNLRRIF
jgi:hypothetical protein